MSETNTASLDEQVTDAQVRAVRTGILGRDLQAKGFARVPGTPSFGRLQTSRMAAGIHHEMFHMRQIELKDVPDRNEWTRLARRHVKRVGRSEFARRWTSNATLNVTWWCVVSLVFLVPIFVLLVMPHMVFPSWSNISWLIAYVIGLVVLVLVAYAPTLLPDVVYVRRRFGVAWGVGFALVYGVIAYELWGSTVNDFVRIPATAALIYATSLVTVVFLGNVLDAIGQTMIDRSARERFPESMLFIQIARAIWYLDTRQAELWKLSSRRYVVEMLDDAAAIIDRWVYKLAQPLDAAGSAWFKGDCQRMCCALREVSRSLIIGNPDVLPAERERLATALAAVARGRWDTFPRAEPDQPVVRERGDVLERATVAVVRGLIPLGLLVALRLSPLHVDNVVMSYAFALAVIWLAINVVGAVDPHFDRHIAALKGVAPMLDLPSRNKGGTVVDSRDEA
jgi:hypothetical protein